MKSLTGISQGIENAQKLRYRKAIFAERLLMIASALKHDSDITIIKSA